MKPQQGTIKNTFGESNVLTGAKSIRHKPLNRAQLFALRMRELDNMHLREIKTLSRQLQQYAHRHHGASRSRTK